MRLTSGQVIFSFHCLPELKFQYKNILSVGVFLNPESALEQGGRVVYPGLTPI